MIMVMRAKFYNLLTVVFLLVFNFSCSKKDSAKEETLFEQLDSAYTNVDFINKLSFNQDFNIYTYRNFYNGGGVAIGDINNDGLQDIYFTANMQEDRLYLNKGNFKFEDITAKAGIAGTQSWSTGVSMADVNGDGWLDIYVCSSGNVEGDPDKHNELFINNKDLTFSERSVEYGVNDRGYSTHAAFFDYDKDGDLDLYVLNNSYQAIGSFNLRKNQRSKRDSLGGHKLYRNDDNKFHDVSEEAGIYGSVIAFGLGVTVGDINNDGWQDIYVSNDFFERDYLYINNQDGTFDERLTESIKSISGASMGADLADINNDGWPDLFVTEMLPQENSRLKTITTFEDWNRYQYNVSNGYYHQFTRNTFQINNGNGTFSEVSRLAGVSATDWSWGALMFDMDNDGLKDIFVANGIYQDLTNQDFLEYASNEEFVKSMVSKKTVDYKKLTEIIPSNKIPNYAFRNSGDLNFSNFAKPWGLATPGFSNGSAYGDLDNDGDMDLVVNNVNMPCFIYRNRAEKLYPEHHYLKFDLIGEGKNTDALGTKITITAGENLLYMEQMPIRGFESSVDPRPNFGLGKINQVERVKVQWPDGRVSLLDSVKADQTIVLRQADAVLDSESNPNSNSTAILALANDDLGIDFIHIENDFVDFDRSPLIYHMLSTEGPRMSKGDVNSDGLEDIFIGGSKGEEGGLYVQVKSGKFIKSKQEVFQQHAISEDMGSVFFDADGDHDNDLYVCSGGNEFSASSSALMDRLYINDGTGKLRPSAKDQLPIEFESTSTVKVSDFDRDGDLDLFTGSRLKPFVYGMPVSGHLLENDGTGKFTDVTKEIAKGLLQLGMITDASWADIDGDDDEDLIIVGEYMAITVFVNKNGKFENETAARGLEKSNGWWNKIIASDLDGDGDVDFVVGNHGTNSRFKASVEKPVTMYVNDFDQNGTIEQIICTYNGSKSFPMVLRHDLIKQIPALKKKYLKYDSYKDQTIEDIFTPEQLNGAIKLEAFELSTCVLVNNGKGNFTCKALPDEAQYAPVFGIVANDFDGDGKKDILLGGNLYRVKPEVGRYDASYGMMLKGDGAGNFAALSAQRSGIAIHGEIREMLVLNAGTQQVVVVARNNDSIQILK